MPRRHFTHLVLACPAHVSVSTRASLLAQPRKLRCSLCLHFFSDFDRTKCVWWFCRKLVVLIFFTKMPGRNHCCACGGTNRRSSHPDLSSHTFPQICTAPGSKQSEERKVTALGLLVMLLFATLQG